MFFLQTQLQYITVKEHLFCKFELAPLTFGPCTSPTDTLHFTYQFSSVSIPTSNTLNCIPICAVENFQCFQLQIKILEILAEEVVTIFDSHIRLIPLATTTFILALQYALVSSDRPRQLTSYAVISHSSPNFHLSLLWCGDFLLKCYRYLFYT